MLQIICGQHLGGTAGHAAREVGGNVTQLLFSKMALWLARGLQRKNSTATEQHGKRAQAESGKHAGSLVVIL
jgi:hypothetical protein